MRGDGGENVGMDGAVLVGGERGGGGCPGVVAVGGGVWLGKERGNWIELS